MLELATELIEISCQTRGALAKRIEDAAMKRGALWREKLGQPEPDEFAIAKLLSADSKFPAATNDWEN